MKALFEIARAKQPCVIFFDEIDALMSARKVTQYILEKMEAYRFLITGKRA